MPPPPSEPGEFTRLLQAQQAQPSRAAAAGSSPLGAAEPGEFTRMLQSPLAPTPGRAAAPPPMFPPTTAGGFNEPGEFTRMLESPLAAQGLAGQPLAAPPPRPQATGDATRAFQAQQAQAGAPAQQGPSEFTKMFKAPPPPPPAPPEPKAVKKPGGRPPIPKKQTNYVLWILVGIAVVLALALVIYLIVK